METQRAGATRARARLAPLFGYCQSRLRPTNIHSHASGVLR